MRYTGGREVFLTQEQAESTIANFHYANPEFDWLLNMNIR